MKNLIVVLQILLGFQAFASASSNDGLKSIAREARLNCTAQMCRGGYELQTVYLFGSDSALPLPVVNALFQQAKSQAQIWGDTILEGDYRSKGDTRLDQIRVLKRGSRTLAYRIVYSETARAPEGNGRIVEASWVQPDFRTTIMDEGQPAEFKLNVR